MPPILYRPGTLGYDAARAGFDLAAIPEPDLAVSARTEADVVAAVAYAAGHDYPVAVRATGHGPIPGVAGGVLVDTRQMRSVRIEGRSWQRAMATV